MKLAALALLLLPQAQEKRYRLPSTDLKQQVIWGSVCEVPDGPSLAFGGMDQKAEDGTPHTRIKVDGAWTSIREELAAHSLASFREQVSAVNGLMAECRSSYFDGTALDGVGLEKRRTEIAGGLGKLIGTLDGSDQVRRISADLKEAQRLLLELKPDPSPATIRALGQVKILLERAGEKGGAEPPSRALSPIAWDPQTKLFVIFGGDHLDYLTNDTWVFDPAKRRWFQRHPESAPPPRANHALKAADGKVTLTGGYTYTSNTDYVGGQYRDLNDGEWTYDIAANRWTGGKGVPSDTRVYRTGRLHPDFYLEGPAPDAAAFSKIIDEIPANTWVRTKPPHLPALNRDWGTAVLDPDRDLILRWSGGHSAHGGTDVLQYHLKTNRWELTIPVEFPLGQLYSNTEYPEGVNFNRRPWVTGHTYQNYGYDPILKHLVFTGRHSDWHLYDPSLGDWVGRRAKPKGMVYNSCFYTLTLTPTPAGLVCWTEAGRLFQLEKEQWVERTLSGAKLPGAVVDNSTVVLDSKRGRLLLARKPYGDKILFTGELHSVDLATWTVTAVSPEGKEGAAGIPYLCQIRYDAAHDLFLVGGTLKPGDDGFRRTPAYDPEKNRWVSLRIGGDDPSGKNGRNVSLGLMYDAKRKLFWAVDTNSQVYVLRLDAASADLRPL